jgi:uncharacterized membrane protein YhaH (DUF805 family)
MNIQESFANCFAKYATTKGVASRSEFWWFYLSTTILGWLYQIFINLQELNLDDEAKAYSTITSIILFVFVIGIPLISVSTRRLHDIGKSGFWQLLVFTIIGIPILIYWLAKVSKTENNKYIVKKEKDNFSINEEKLYQIAFEEIKEKKQRSGLWSMCIAEANGNEQIANATYIKKRVNELSENRNNEITTEVLVTQVRQETLKTQGQDEIKEIKNYQNLTFLMLHKETFNVIKRNIVEVAKFTAPFIILSFFWSAFIGERYATQIESVILMAVITLPLAFTCIFVFRKEFLKNYEQSFSNLFAEKVFLQVFIYWLSVKIIPSIANYANEFSKIDGYEEFYSPVINLLIYFFWFRYINFIYQASIFRNVTIDSIATEMKGYQIKNLINITLYVAYIAIFFLLILVTIGKIPFFPAYLTKPFFVFFNWIIGVIIGIIVASSLTVINKRNLI